MTRSEQINELATALAKAQAEMAGAKKDAQNPHFKSSYADLASVWDAARPALTKHGLAVTQFTIPTERDEVLVETTILHSSGQWLAGRIAIPVDKHNAHGYGSALTYARRYALAAAVGIAPEDDDGNEAAKSAPKKRDNDLSARGAAAGEAFNSLDKAGQEAMMAHAQKLEETYQAFGIAKATDAFEALGFDADGQLAIWYVMDSGIRNRIKEERRRRRERQPLEIAA